MFDGWHRFLNEMSSVTVAQLLNEKPSYSLRKSVKKYYKYGNVRTLVCYYNL